VAGTGRGRSCMQCGRLQINQKMLIRYPPRIAIVNLSLRIVPRTRRFKRHNRRCVSQTKVEHQLEHLPERRVEVPRESD
jgi:hypothetical protein